MQNFDSTMKVSWLILLIIDGLLLAANSVGTAYSSGPTLYISIIYLCVYISMVIYLINKLATKDGLLKNNNMIGIWGYIWRYFVTKYLVLIAASIITVLIFGKGPFLHIPLFLFITLMHALISIIFIWALFSKNRKEQFYWVLSSIRGY